MTTDDLLRARTTDWSAAERAELARVVAALRPSPRHLGDILDWLDDVAARAGGRPAAILTAPELTAALGAKGSAPDRLKRWKAALRRLRYPRLAARESALATAIRALDLGSGIVVRPPPDLEGGTVEITIRAGSAAELAASLARLESRLASGDVARLFALLD